MTEEVRVSETFGFVDQDKCDFQVQESGAILAFCVNTVDRMSDRTLRFNVKWHANVPRTLMVNAIARGKSLVGDTLPFLVDELGNVYNFSAVDGAATAPFFLKEGDNVEGSFLFPPVAEGVTTVNLIDKDVNTEQELTIKDIVLQ